MVIGIGTQHGDSTLGLGTCLCITARPCTMTPFTMSSPITGLLGRASIRTATTMQCLITRLVILTTGMVATFMIVSDLKPYRWPRQFDLRSTDDKHVMAIDLALNHGKSKSEIASILKAAGASEVNEKNFE